MRDLNWKVNLARLSVFEAKSVVARLIGLDRPRLSRDVNYLNLGCGSNIVDGMVNADFFPGFGSLRRRPKLDWKLDLRYPLNCPDAVFNGVFSEHTLEHLYPDEVRRLLRELFRVMKDGALIRLTVPDLAKYIQFYTGKMTDPDLRVFQERFESRAAALRSLTQNYFHVSLWDFEELKLYMEEAGFSEVRERSFGECGDLSLCRDLMERGWETLYVEGRKHPMTDGVLGAVGRVG